ncbi:MAG TPA: helix-turn-helix transcriptional regulator [Gammaproteobacteria bacterium]|jgi:transcriptional regulator with XRE-family HTH domain|nr:helix-turn-helix transcriptional regulator [Gammaproteobacteria bacterium]
MIFDGSAEAIGKRLRVLRDTAGLTLQEFCKTSGVSYPSLSYWENALIISPLKPKSMEKVIHGFKKIGIDVSEEWLRYGKGTLPTLNGEPLKLEEERNLNPDNIKTFPAVDNTQLARIFAEETKLFASLKQAVILKVDHSRMMPFFEKGDHVGGIWQPASTLIDTTVSIFQLKGNLHVAYIKKSAKENLFKISYLVDENKKNEQSQLITLESIAPVIRIWR